MKDYKQKNVKQSYSDDWATPKHIYDKYMSDGFIDPCPLYANDFNFEPIDEKLFINPPYSNITKWVEYAINNHYYCGKKIVLLVPSRTDTKWFHKLLDYGVKLEFIKGRLKFGNSKTSAPFPSVLIHLE